MLARLYHTGTFHVLCTCQVQQKQRPVEQGWSLHDGVMVDALDT